MSKYNITTHKFELDGEEYFLRPLGGAHIDLLFKVLGTFQEVNDKIDREMPEGLTKEEREERSGAQFMSSLPDAAIKDLHKLTFETMKNSDKDADLVALDGFVTQNLFTLMNHVIKVNMNSKGE